MSRQRQRGTAAESAIVAYLTEHGFPYAERRASNGNRDRGDIAGVPGVVIEAKDCVRFEPAAWLDEATTEAANAKAQVAAVWFKRRGRSDPGRWFVLMDGETFVGLVR